MRAMRVVNVNTVLRTPRAANGSDPVWTTDNEPSSQVFHAYRSNGQERFPQTKDTKRVNSGRRESEIVELFELLTVDDKKPSEVHLRNGPGG